MREPRPLLDGTAELGVEWRSGWLKADRILEADAKAFWQRLSLLPGGVDPDLRLDEIVSAAYVKDELVAVSTALVREVPFLRARLAMFRCAVDPEYRRHSISRKIAGHSKEVLEEWSFEHQDQGVLGMGTVLQNEEMASRSRAAIWRTSGLVLVGYTDEGEQIRVAWFDHARV
jgi:hypothetical protein